jgi:magnesium-transporting ATPase (P-type)
MTVDVHPATEEPPSAAVDPEEAIDLLLRHLGTRLGGLEPREAARRLQQHGPNEIRRREGPGHLRALARQFTHPLALLLWVAGALALVADLAPLAAAIVAVIVLNAAFAFMQELQAERATEALREFLPAQAKVRRDGRERDIDARELVPGDVILLSEGDRLSADARLVDGALEVDMSPLTGEPQPLFAQLRPGAPSPVAA